MIVVVIMAVLAATIIPRFSASTEDAKTSQLRFNVHTLRSQTELKPELQRLTRRRAVAESLP